MDLKSYISEKRVPVKTIATSLGCTPPFVYHLAAGRKPCPPVTAIEIERLTGGEVSRYDLRPKDGHLIWPDDTVPAPACNSTQDDLREGCIVSQLRIEQSVREALTDPRKRDDVARAMNWDSSNVSRILSGQMGVTIDKIDALVSSLGYVLVTPRYLNALATMSEVGVHCQCAREGGGECGR